MVAEAIKAGQMVCGKCGRVNDATARHCAYCEAHLYVACTKCGAVNSRSEPRCRGCGNRLHRSAWSRFRRHTLKRVKLWEIVLVLVVSVLFVFLLVRMNKRSNPPTTPGGDWSDVQAPSFR